jgi:ribosomal protein S3AE
MDLTTDKLRSMVKKWQVGARLPTVVTLSRNLTKLISEKYVTLFKVILISEKQHVMRAE